MANYRNVVPASEINFTSESEQIVFAEIVNEHDEPKLVSIYLNDSLIETVELVENSSKFDQHNLQLNDELRIQSDGLKCRIIE